jgi:hypothetical protein
MMQESCPVSFITFCAPPQDKDRYDDVLRGALHGENQMLSAPTCFISHKSHQKKLGVEEVLAVIENRTFD